MNIRKKIMRANTKYKHSQSDLDWTKRWLKVIGNYWTTTQATFNIQHESKTVCLCKLHCKLDKGTLEDIARVKKALAILGWKFDVDFDRWKPETIRSTFVTPPTIDSWETLELLEKVRG